MNDYSTLIESQKAKIVVARQTAAVAKVVVEVAKEMNGKPLSKAFATKIKEKLGTEFVVYYDKPRNQFDRYGISIWGGVLQYNNRFDQSLGYPCDGPAIIDAAKIEERLASYLNNGPFADEMENGLGAIPVIMAERAKLIAALTAIDESLSKIGVYPERRY